MIMLTDASKSDSRSMWSKIPCSPWPGHRSGKEAKGNESAPEGVKLFEML